MQTYFTGWVLLMKRENYSGGQFAGIADSYRCSAEYSVNDDAAGILGRRMTGDRSVCFRSKSPLANQAFDRVIYDAMTVPYMSLRAYGQHGEDALIAGEVEIRRLDDLLSTGKKGSDTEKVNADGGGVLTEDTAYLTKVSLDLYESTDGAFDIAVYPLMELWGFTSQFENEADKTESIQRAAPCRGKKVALSPGLMLQKLNFMRRPGR